MKIVITYGLIFKIEQNYFEWKKNYNIYLEI